MQFSTINSPYGKECSKGVFVAELKAKAEIPLCLSTVKNYTVRFCGIHRINHSASSANPLGPCSSKRFRHWITVGREVDSRAAVKRNMFTISL